MPADEVYWLDLVCILEYCTLALRITLVTMDYLHREQSDQPLYSTYENAITTLNNYILFILPNRLTTSLPPLLFRTISHLGDLRPVTCSPDIQTIKSLIKMRRPTAHHVINRQWRCQ